MSDQSSRVVAYGVFTFKNGVVKHEQREPDLVVEYGPHCLPELVGPFPRHTVFCSFLVFNRAQYYITRAEDYAEVRGMYRAFLRIIRGLTKCGSR